MDTSIYYDINPILSYNRPVSIICGVRGPGKTYSVKKMCIKNFLENKQKFIWMRRYKDEFKGQFKIEFSSDIQDEFPGVDISIAGETIIINKAVAGYLVPLSTAIYKKGTAYPDTGIIAFDEFLIESKNIRYLPDEFSLFTSFCDTVFRLRAGKILMMANAISTVNPYFDGFKIYPKNEPGFYKNEKCVIQITADKAFISAREKSMIGTIIHNTSYDEYSTYNKFYHDSNTFLSHIPKTATLDGAFLYDGKRYGIYYDINAGKVYIGKTNDLTMQAWAITSEDHTPNTLLLRGLKKVKVIEFMKQAFSYGIIYFENQTAKKDFYDIMQMFNVK